MQVHEKKTGAVHRFSTKLIQLDLAMNEIQIWAISGWGMLTLYYALVLKRLTIPGACKGMPVASGIFQPGRQVGVVSCILQGNFGVGH